MRMDGRVFQMSGNHCWCSIKYGQYPQLAIAVCPWLRVGIFYFKVGGMSKPIISPL